jgi:hypothetical protein
MKSKIISTWKRAGVLVDRFVRRFIWIRVSEFCVTPYHMKLAYHDHTRREAIMVAWPLNYVVQLAWMLNVMWCRYRHNPSWIDKELSRQISQESSLCQHESNFRAMAHAIGSEGTVFYRVQKRRWWGWKTMGGYLCRSEASQALSELYSANVASDLSSPTGGASGPKAERGAGVD